jgi:transposase
LNAPNDFKNKYKITQLRLGHPANSPDLNPIERIWRRVKQRVKRRKARNEDELRRFIEEEWDRITIQEINKEILTMEERINQCIERGGDVTEF